ncbi:DUF1642 domain-containing protein [Listeria monocytogenes]|uniref:DUF1642 domain-containing protein n=1 Tax=Listeria monocytogenes TaxID=1639 RepID=UPI000E74A6F1|nr:DUF1642 domain-containing protein [Listeria monocytogenes]EHT9616489.1 DUF1642 domain-containing protein [Listeria monocytogenes]RKA19306.1 hypothetical protein DYZ83_00116 [Listeria monocytogenes]
MRFKEGDRVELILRSKKRVGTVEEVYNDTQKCKVQIDGFPVTVTKPQKYLVKAEEPELVVVPQCVDDWFIFCTSVGYDLANALYIVKGHMPVAIYEWLQNNNDNQELLARAWMDGYEVEKEPLYYVRLPIVRLNTLGTAVEKDNKYLGVDPETGESNIFQGLTLPYTLSKSGWETKLTEQEIKAIDERFLTFAIPVEEVEEESK